MTINNKSSFYMQQVRSMWVPKNWYWYSILLLGLLSYNLPLYVAIISLLLISICMHSIENIVYFNDDIDTIADRSYYLKFIRILTVVIVIFAWSFMNMFSSTFVFQLK